MLKHLETDFRKLKEPVLRTNQTTTDPCKFSPPTSQGEDKGFFKGFLRHFLALM